MKQRGRKSSAVLTLVTGSQVVEPFERIEPLPEMTADEIAIWKVVVADYPPDKFSVSHSHLLAQYCRHAVAANNVSKMIKDRVPGNIGELDLLCKMQERESRALKTLATSLVLTPRSQVNQRGNKIGQARRKPWEG